MSSGTGWIPRWQLVGNDTGPEQRATFMLGAAKRYDVRRRAFLTTAAAVTFSGVAGCFWEDEETSYELATVGVGNYLDRNHRVEVRIEENGDEAMTTEVELGPGTNMDPGFERLDCGWSGQAGQYTVEVRHLGDPPATQTVELPGSRSRQMDLETCVGVSFYIGSPSCSFFCPMIGECESMLDSVEMCTDEHSTDESSA